MSDFVMPIAPILEWPEDLPIDAVKHTLRIVEESYFTYTCTTIFWYVQTYSEAPVVEGESEQDAAERNRQAISLASKSEYAYQTLLVGNRIAATGSGFSNIELPEELRDESFAYDPYNDGVFDQHHRAGFLRAVIAEYERLTANGA